jgi:hypothetical protein
VSELSVERGGAPISQASAEQGFPRVIYDWEDLARRMGVDNVRKLTRKQLKLGLVMYGTEVGTVDWGEGIDRR